MFIKYLKKSQTINKFIRNLNNNTTSLIKVNVNNKNGDFFEIQGEYNDTLFDIIQKNKSLNIDLLKDCLEFSCQGMMACSTCHVYIDDDWYKFVNKPCENEEDILDLVFDRRENSKLGCQLRLNSFLNGIKIIIPAEKNNLF